MRPSARRTSTTVVAIVGDGARACVERLGRGANVATLVPEPDDPPLDRAVAAWSDGDRGCTCPTSCTTPTRSTPSPTRGCAASTAKDRSASSKSWSATRSLRWRAGSIELPDYYLVLDAEAWAPHAASTGTSACSTRAAPARVVPVLGADAADAALRRLTRRALVARSRRAARRHRPRRARSGGHREPDGDGAPAT